MKKLLFLFTLLTIQLFNSSTGFAQANTYWHDRIDTTIYATTTNSSNAYTGTNLNTNFNVARYVKGLTVNTFIINHNTGAATYKLVTASGTLSTIPIRKAGGTALASGDIPDSSAITLLYYGSFWRLIGVHTSTSLTNEWHITGNSGTTVGTNFLGTTDNQPLEFKVNNVLSGYISPTPKERTSLGQYAGNVDTALTNTWIGYGAGRLSVSSNSNTAVGVGAEYNHKTGNNITAIGSHALYLDTISAEMVAIGFQALYNEFAGTADVAIGNSALFNANADQGNVSIGNTSLQSITTGSFNTAIGDQAASGLTTNSTYNVAIGYKALMGANNTNSNVAIGRESFKSNTGGTFNVGVGQLTGGGNVSGSNNCFFGTNTGNGNTGSGNVFLGFLVGNSTWTGNSNLFLVDNGDNATGFLVGDIANKRLAINSSVVPSQQLEVNGNITVVGQPNGIYLQDSSAPNHYFKITIIAGVLTATDTGSATKP